MRKTLNINIGGMAFIIDENAFELLHNYLEALKRKFNNEAERQEILNDIESRIAEMLGQKLADRKQVVGIEEVQAVISAMGQPEDIAGEEAAETTGTAYNSTATAAGSNYEPVKKRLFRDADDAKIAGVISGLCHYFGINDPVWMRIAAIILIFVTSGSVILLYLLLVIIVPKAVTSAEKLQMKGEPININTIEKEIKDSFTRTGESVSRFMKEDTFFERTGGIVLSIVKAVLRLFIAFVLMVAVILLMVVIFLFFTTYILGTSQFSEVTHFIANGRNTLTYFSFGFLLFFGAPLLSIIYGSLRVFTGRRTRQPWVSWTLLTAWLMGIVLLSFTGYRTAVNFHVPGIKREQTALMQPAGGMLYVQLTDTNGRYINRDDEEEDESFNINEDGVFINGVNLKDMERIPLAKPDLEIMASDNDSFYLQQIISAKGRTKADANKNAAATIYTFSQTDTILNLSPRLYMGKNGNWRGQDIKIRIAIPEGKKIRFARNIDLWTAVVKGDRSYDDTYFANTTWTVENGKVKCIGGENHFNAKEDTNTDEEEANKAAQKTSDGKTKQKQPGENDADDDENSEQDY